MVTVVFEVVECKCNNYYIKNDKNQCDKCINNNHNSKNKQRLKLKLFKEKLGGQCIDCGLNELFFLEFDHINPSKKTIQITRSSSDKWENEKSNLELRCGRCHRIKTNNGIFSGGDWRSRTESGSRRSTSTEGDGSLRSSYFDKKSFVTDIKKIIGRCQFCNWTLDDIEKICPALDFDHVIGEKVDQISNLYTFTDSVDRR
jgi:hypothetical protein